MPKSFFRVKKGAGGVDYNYWQKNTDTDDR